MAHPGTLQSYTKRLTVFEHGAISANNKSNIILWIGGLGDGPLGVRYPASIARSLPSDWTIAEVLLSSAYNGWGTGSLDRDAKEISRCVAYFKKQRPSAKIVLMGHSTGCQDIMEYLTGSKQYSDDIEGAILQAGVSDRQAFEAIVADDEEKKKSLKDTIAIAHEWIEKGDGDEVLHSKNNAVLGMLGAPCTAYRAHSLLAHGGDDDYFSTDLPDETLKNTFGKIPHKTKVMFLWGSKDPYIPKEVDQEATLKRWAGFVKQGGTEVDEENGGVVQGATHNLNDDPEEVVQDLIKRVIGFVKGI